MGEFTFMKCLEQCLMCCRYHMLGVGFFFFFFLVFLAPYLWHMEVPRLGIELELQLLPQPQQHRIQATSATYTTTHGKAQSLTH